MTKGWIRPDRKNGVEGKRVIGRVNLGSRRIIKQSEGQEGLPQEATDVMKFTAPDSGSFRIFCGVPGHGLSGMWIRFTVDPVAKAPRFETKSSP